MIAAQSHAQRQATTNAHAMSVRLDDARPAPRWAIDTLARWLGVDVVAAPADEPADLYYGDDAARGIQARVWIRPDPDLPRALRLAAQAIRIPADRSGRPDAAPGFDLPAVLAYLLTCGDARESAARDADGRLPDEDAWIARVQLEHLPVCHLWAEQLLDALRRRGWTGTPRPLWPAGKRWAVALTHGVDFPRQSDVPGRRQRTRVLLAEGRFRDAARQLAIALWSSVRAALRRDDPKTREASDVPMHGVRHHAWRPPAAAPWEGWRAHAAAGLAYDLSMSFTGRAGFRCGAALPFRAIDLCAGQVLPVWVLPCLLTNSNLCDGRTTDEAVATGINYLETCQRFGLCAVVNWHDGRWNDRGACRGREEVARALRGWLARQDDAWVASAGEVAGHFERRLGL